MSRLRQARALIEDEEHWTTGMYVKSYPTRYCAMGALLTASATDNGDFIYSTSYWEDKKALTDAAWALFPDVADQRLNPLIAVNDKLGHEAIMQVFEKAIVEVYGSL